MSESRCLSLSTQSSALSPYLYGFAGGLAFGLSFPRERKREGETGQPRMRLAGTFRLALAAVGLAPAAGACGSRGGVTARAARPAPGLLQRHCLAGQRPSGEGPP